MAIAISKVAIQALGRGTIVDRSSLYRSFGDGVPNSTKVWQLINGFCICFAIDNCERSLSRNLRLVRHYYRVSMTKCEGDDERRYMARVEGIDPRQTSFPMRQVFRKVRKMLGRDLTPQKIAARVPRVFWVSALAEWLLGQKAAVPQRQRMLLTLRTAVRAGCPF